jgi:hypothetical protein
VSVLTLDVGGANIQPPCQKGGHAAPRKTGDRGFQFSGGEVNGIRAENMIVPVILFPRTFAQAVAIRALFALGAQVPCAGDVFNNGGATIVCSGTITDELDETDAWWTINLTLFEIGTTLGYVPTTTIVWLTGILSDLDTDGSLFLASLVSVNPGDSYMGIRVLDTETGLACGGIPDPFTDCPTHFSAAAERKWITRPLKAGYLLGQPTVSINSKGGTGDWLAHQGSRFDLYQWRASVDIAGPYPTEYGGNGGFAGGDVVTTCQTALNRTIDASDRLRFDLWGRIALHSGYADGNVPGDFTNLYRQGVFHGYLGGGPGVSFATLVGTVEEL